MTHDILTSDVELAKRLIGEGETDDGVITALVHRGIDREAAAQLVDDLHNGRKIVTKVQAGSEMTMRRRSRSRKSGESRHPEREREHSRSARSGEPSPSHSHSASESHSHSHSHSESSSHSHSHEHSEKKHGKPAAKKRRFKFWPWIVMFLVCVSAAIGGLVYFNHGQFTKGDSWSNRFATPASARELPEDSRHTTGNLAPTDVALEFRPTGLHLAGVLINRDNALKVAADVLGSPTRTIPGREAGAMNYAFDDYGIVICGQKDGVNGSILLDCDAVGGPTGTRAGFKGLLRVENGEPIRAETGAKTLAAMKKLGLKNEAAESSIIDGRYQNLDLVFVYLKTPARLSTVQIDFR